MTIFVFRLKHLRRTLSFLHYRAVSPVVTDTGTSIYLTPNVLLSDSADGQTYLICVLPRADAYKLRGFTKGE